VQVSPSMTPFPWSELFENSGKQFIRYLLS